MHNVNQADSHQRSDYHRYDNGEGFIIDMGDLVLQEPDKQACDQESIASLFQGRHHGRPESMIGIDEPYDGAHEQGTPQAGRDVEVTAYEPVNLFNVSIFL
jgi:hypothetical protein